MFRLLVFLAMALAAHARDFDPRRDGFAFANETVFSYGVDERGRLQMAVNETQPPFTRRCFCLVRASLQFWKFARFEPHAPQVTGEEYRARIRRLFRIPAWMPARDSSRIAIPGYADLWGFSKAQTRMVQEEIGEWLPTFMRPGNWRMPCPLTRLFQPWTAGAVARAIERGQPQALYVAKFPSMNHALIAFAVRRLPGGTLRFSVYDPNYPGKTARLDYLPQRMLFDFEPRFYWPGGVVRAMRIYISPVH